MKNEVLIIDNYDSFTYNVYHLFTHICDNVIVKRPYELTLESIFDLDPTLIVISPGPGTPENAEFSLSVIDVFKELKPIFGICLGMQCMVSYFNGEVKSHSEPVHGKQFEVISTKKSFLKDLPEKFNVARYHSLYASVVPEQFDVIAKTKDNIVMAIKHKQYKMAGVQFHPESFLTDFGIKMVESIVTGNF